MRRLGVLVVVPLLLFVAACGDDDDGVGAGASEDFCEKAEAVDAQFDELDNLGGDAMPTSESLGEAAGAIEDLARDAPEEIDADLDTLAEGMTALAEALEGIDLSDPAVLQDPEVMARLAESQAELEDVGEDLERSGERVETYLQEECGLDTDDEAELEMPDPTETTEPTDTTGATETTEG